MVATQPPTGARPPRRSVCIRLTTRHSGALASTNQAKKGTTNHKPAHTPRTSTRGTTPTSRTVHTTLLCPLTFPQHNTTQHPPFTTSQREAGGFMVTNHHAPIAHTSTVLGIQAAQAQFVTHTPSTPHIHHNALPTMQHKPHLQQPCYPTRNQHHPHKWCHAWRLCCHQVPCTAATAAAAAVTRGEL